MRISDWSSDVCSSDLPFGLQIGIADETAGEEAVEIEEGRLGEALAIAAVDGQAMAQLPGRVGLQRRGGAKAIAVVVANSGAQIDRLAEPAPPFGHQRGGLAGAQLIGGGSEEHTAELQSLMRIS